VYVIEVKNQDGPGGDGVEVTVDGVASADGSIRLVDDGARHEVSVQRMRATIKEPRPAAEQPM
jgi:hypothetical protein